MLIFSQAIIGIVLDKESGQPISYSSIGLIGKNGGVYADYDGRFNFNISDYDKSDSLRFSCVGYTSVAYSLSQLMNITDLKVFLDKKVTELKEVFVTPRKYKTVELGNKISNKHICICGYNDYENGIVITNNKKIFLDKLTFKISSVCSVIPDSILIRVNIYNTKNSFPDKLLIDNPIYFMLSKELKNYIISLNLVDYGIIINSDFAVTIEVIKKFGNGKICFAGWISGSQTISKSGKQGVWLIPTDSKKKKLKIFQSMIITARLEK